MCRPRPRNDEGQTGAVGVAEVQQDSQKVCACIEEEQAVDMLSALFTCDRVVYRAPSVCRTIAIPAPSFNVIPALANSWRFGLFMRQNNKFRFLVAYALRVRSRSRLLRDI
jgi:hypothetical protein